MIRALTKQFPFLHAAALKAKHRLWQKRTKKGFKNYRAGHDVLKLQLGAGTNNLPGWFNTDYFSRPTIFFLDVTKKTPFPSNAFQFVYSEHHIEHIGYKDAMFMLAENFRIMKTGGFIKIITPDLKKYIAAYAGNQLRQPIIKQHVNDWVYAGFDKAVNYIPVDDYYEAHFINDIFLNYEHRFIYDEESLKRLLEKAGFVNIINTGADYVEQPEFTGIESHGSAFDGIFNLSMKAQKPAV